MGQVGNLPYVKKSWDVSGSEANHRLERGSSVSRQRVNRQHDLG
jgi:hypothetical protein